MESRVQNAIAKIEVVRGGRTVSRGTASLVGPDLVLTALHVVADRATALRLTPQLGTPALPVHDGEIWLTFPNHLPIKARTLEGKWDARQDWALLESLTPVPASIAPLPLATLDRDGDHWETYGFPDAKADGLGAGGAVRSVHGHVAGETAYQLYCVEAAAGDGMPVSGLSGAPVVIAGRLVGILRWAVLQHESKNVGGAVYACPAERFAAPCGYGGALPSVAGMGSAGITAAPAAARPDGREWLARPATWLLVAAVLLAVVTVWLTQRGTAVPPEAAVATPGPVVPVPDVNALSFQVIVDRSNVMNEPFGQGTKLDAAKQALTKVLLDKTSDRDNLALREFGGDCDDRRNTRLVLPFAPGEQRLADEVRSLTTTAGDSTLVNAVIEATGDFNAQAGVRARSGIIVIAGSFNGCGYEDPGAVIRERLKSYPELVLDLRFIGVALTRQAQSSVGRLARATGGTFRNAVTPAQLNQAVEQALIVQTMVAEVDQAGTALNDCQDHLNTAIATHLKQLDYEAAGREVAAAEAALRRTQIPASEPGLPEGVRELLAVARQARDDQQKMVQAATALIAAKRAGDAAAETAAREAYNAATASFNGRQREINRRQAALLANTAPSNAVSPAGGAANTP